jgi:hypothetical protein
MGAKLMAENKRKFVINPEKPFFIYDTRGDWHATLINGCLWDARGEYIGFVRGEDHNVYTSFGEWIGNLTPDGRIVRRRVYERQPILRIRRLAPPRPTNLPPRAPLPPLTAELGYHLIDVLDWDPDVFKNVPDRKPDLE